MKKIKRTVYGFLGAVQAEVERFRRYVDAEDAKWEADPVGMSKKWDAAFWRYAWATIAALTGAVIVRAVFSVV